MSTESEEEIETSQEIEDALHDLLVETRELLMREGSRDGLRLAGKIEFALENWFGEQEEGDVDGDEEDEDDLYEEDEDEDEDDEEDDEDDLEEDE